MDLDYLLKQVQAACDEADALNRDGPEYAKLLDYLNKEHADPAHSRIAYGVVAEVGAMLRKMEAERDRGHDALYRIAHALGWSGPQPSPIATDELTANLVSQVVAAIRERDELRKHNSAANQRADLVPWPSDKPPRYNACTDPCDMWTGPCACGAWHVEGK